MNRVLTQRTCIVTLLLCAILISLTGLPHCDVCDRIPVVSASSLPVVHQHVPAAPDTCNGQCSCCVLQCLPTASPALERLSIALANDRAASPRAAHSLPFFIFRPPRMHIS